MKDAKYIVRTYDHELKRYTSQDGVPLIATGLAGLRRALRALRAIGYSSHSRRQGKYRWCNDTDTAVYVSMYERSRDFSRIMP